MTSTSFDSSAMETSTFLRDIADFDVKGPISVTICFEDDIDDNPLKTGIKGDDYQKESPAIDNSAFVPILEPKKETQVEAFNSCTANIEFSNNVIVENKPPDAVHKTEKRKQDEPCVPSSSPKRSKLSEGLENNYEKDERLKSFFRRKNENAPEKSTHSVIVNGLPQNEMDKMNVCITNCLATISEHMRCIMEAYDFHKQHKTPKETFKNIKVKHFKSAFKYISTILLPEEKNSEFIQTFLKDTVQRAHNAAGPNHVRTYQDYANLLFEMLMWGRQAQHQISQAVQNRNVNSVTSTALDNTTLIGPKHPVQDTQHDNTKANYSNESANADKVCIFSSGLPGREFSINIDQVKYLQLTGQDRNAESNTLQKSRAINDQQKTESGIVASNQVQETMQSIKEFAAKCHNLNKITRQPAMQIEVPQISKLAPQMPPSLPLYQPMQPQQQKSQAPPPPYGILPHIQAEYDQARHAKMLRGQYLPRPPQYVQAPLRQVIPPQCDPSRQLQAQLGQNPQTQPQYDRAQIIQPQNTYMQYQSGHAFGQLGQKLHHNLSGQSQMQQQYIHSRDSQISQQQRPSDRFPSMAALLSQDSMLPSTHASTNKLPQSGPWEYGQQQSEQSNNANHQHLGSTHYLYQIQNKTSFGQWHSQNRDAQQSQPMPVAGTQWQQELNAIYQGGALPQTQKGSPRAASTDSGFISPLNFNTSIDQTIPASPREPETSLPLITHVTSLSEKAAFVENGKCVVCKKSTKQMCMGCMKIYYCTYQCQTQDWGTHASYCMQETTNSGSTQPS